MSANSSIEWTDRTWNPVRGCSVISPGCVNCYAMKQAHRFSGEGRAYEGLTKLTKAGPQWTGKIRTVESALLDPLSWRKPQRVFVNNMSDLFHEDVPREFITQVFAVMQAQPYLTFQVLTKRPERMRELLSDRQFEYDCETAGDDMAGERGWCHANQDRPWPLSNVWLGVSVENKDALERIHRLKDTPAAVRFVSFEPLLEHLGAVRLDGIHWGIIGGESGPRARRCAAAWIRSLVRECRRQGVAPFVKQMGANVIDRNDAGFDGCGERSWPEMDPDDIEDDINGYREEYQGADVRVRLNDRKGGDMAEWPVDLQVREFPGLPRRGAPGP